jgi:hypothetical protein
METIIDKFNKIRKMSFRVLVPQIIHKLKHKICKYKKNTEENNRKKESRIQSFKQFTNKYILETPYIITSDNIPSDLAEQFDIFIVGSDQVWNPHFRMGSSIDFLTFAPEYKRVAYSASFGISTLPTVFIKNYRQWLSCMAHISVREDAGTKIIKELTGRDVPVIVDPTLMLTKEKWMAISKTPMYKPKKPYLLTYFLGNVSPEDKKKINSIANEKRLEIIHLAEIEDARRYSADPSEFLGYINSSKVFLTDSFHGVIFSIIFEKPFIVFNRLGKYPSMNSRIDTLLSKFKLEDRKWENIKTENNIFDIDFSHIPPIIEAERNKALNYLKSALDIDDVNYKKLIEK